MVVLIISGRRRVVPLYKVMNDEDVGFSTIGLSSRVVDESCYTLSLLLDFLWLCISILLRCYVLCLIRRLLLADSQEQEHQYEVDNKLDDENFER